MPKVLTDIYGSIYVTDRAVLELQHELRKQKTITGLLALGLVTTVLYMIVDVKYDEEQNQRIKKLEQDVQRMSMGA